MLSNNMLRNLSASYNKMGKLQEQIASGKKLSRPSDDPGAVMKGMAYRMQVDKINQYQRNLGEVNNWLDNTDEALNQVGQVLHRTNELVTQGASDSISDGDRENLKVELKQLQNRIKDLANTKVAGKYIFSGTNTGEPLFKDGELQEIGTNPNKTPLPGFEEKIEIKVFDGVKIEVNTQGFKMFQEIDKMFEGLIEKDNLTQEDYNQAIGAIGEKLDNVVSQRADIGGRQNRVEMMDARLSALELSSTKRMSENEDIEFEKVITEMFAEEAIHRASLSVGARIIQPSLVDFLR